MQQFGTRAKGLVVSSGSLWIEEIRDGNCLIRSSLCAKAGLSPVLWWCCWCFTNAHLSSTPEACPSLVVGCFLDQMQFWCSVTDFTWLYWASYLVFGVVGSADSKRELCLPTCTTHCLNFVGNMQLLFSAGSRKDVRRFANAPSLE